MHLQTAETFDGVLVFQDPAAPAYQGNNLRLNKLTGSSTLDLTGAIYIPNQELEFRGGAASNIQCLQMVAGQVTFTGESKVANTCDSNTHGTEKIARINIEIVE